MTWENRDSMYLTSLIKLINNIDLILINFYRNLDPGQVKIPNKELKIIYIKDLQ